jgi:hypothetical protein
MEGKKVGWTSIDEPMTDLPQDLDFIQLCTSRSRAYQLTCHVMVVALYEQDRNMIQIGSHNYAQTRSFQDVFFIGSKWHTSCAICNTHYDNPGRELYDWKLRGAHPDFLAAGVQMNMSGGLPIEQTSGTGLMEFSFAENDTLGRNVEHHHGENFNENVLCPECERLLHVGSRFKRDSPNQKEDTRLYLARRLGIGEIVFEAWEAAKPVTAAILLG